MFDKNKVLNGHLIVSILLACRFIGLRGVCIFLETTKFVYIETISGAEFLNGVAKKQKLGFVC